VIFYINRDSNNTPEKVHREITLL